MIYDKKRVMYQLPTGGGKTAVAGELARKWIENGSICSRIIWLTHRRELEIQSSTRLITDHGIDSDRLIVTSPIKMRNRSLTVGSNDLMIIDESHHATAPSWSNIIKNTKCSILGISATPWRMSKREGFDHLYDELVQGPSVSELIESGFLVRPQVFSPNYGVIKGYGRSAGDYSMSATWGNSNNKHLLVERGIDWLGSFGKRKSIVYTVGVRHAYAVHEYASKLGFRSGLLLGYNSKNYSLKEYNIERLTVLNNFKNGNIDMIVNCEVLTEGIDIPTCDTVLKLRPTLSLALDMQMSGRVMRILPGHERKSAMILDAANNFIEHGLPDIDRKWSLSPRATIKKTKQPYRLCPSCYIACSIAIRKCPKCSYSFGQVCSMCGNFRIWDLYDTEDIRCTVCSNAMQDKAFNPEELERVEHFRESMSVQNEINSNKIIAIQLGFHYDQPCHRVSEYSRKLNLKKFIRRNPKQLKML